MVQVQERALKVVPDLCETIDYAEVSNVLFPRVAVSYKNLIHEYRQTLHVQLVFTKTRILTVKVATLVTFLSMVKTLDQVCCSSISLFHNIHLSTADKPDAKASAATVKNPDKGACCYGEVHLVPIFMF